MKPVSVKGFSGINNVDDPSRLFVKDGISPLAACDDIDVTPKGRMERRRGTTLKQSGSFHSLWADGDCFCVKSGSLYRVNEDYSLTGLRAGMSNLPVSFQRLGKRVYYCSEAESGYIEGNVSHAWDVTLEDDSKDLTVLRGHLLSSYRSRILVGSGSVLWMSEAFSPHVFRPSTGYLPFGSRLKSVFPVSDGFYVSDSQKIYFFGGESAPLAQKREVYGLPALGAAACDASHLGLDPSQGHLVATEKGVCFAGPGGFFTNLTERFLKLPRSQRASLTVTERNHYPQLLLLVKE